MRDQPPFTVDEIDGREPAELGRQHVRTTHELLGLRADLLDRGALARRRGELLQHDALIETVRALGQPMRTGSLW